MGAVLRWIVIACAMVMVAGATQARTMEEKLQAVCRDEIRTLCPDRTPDDIQACMLHNRAKVSAACIKMIDAAE